MRTRLGIRNLWCWTGVGPLLLAGWAGCAPANTPAEFQAGGEQDVLDGATIQDDGTRFELTMDSKRQLLSRVDIDGGQRYIEFDPELSEQLGVPVPRVIATHGHMLEVDVRSGAGSLTVDLPLQGPQTFTFQTSDALAMFGLQPRMPLQLPDAGCERAVGALDELCELFQAHGPQALDEVIDLALRLAKQEGIPDLASGFIEQVVNDFYDVLEDFCNAWTEVRDGSSEKDPLDPCSL
jgi:hypothetical protein